MNLPGTRVLPRPGSAFQVASLFLFYELFGVLTNLFGGYLDSFHGKPIRKWLWKVTNWLNPRHPQFAWVSLFGVALADLYVRLCSMGVITDYRLF